MDGSNMGLGRARYSIYYPYCTESPGLESLVGDQAKGFRAARNLLKCLNHLDLLQHKEAIAMRLAVHNTRTPRDLFQENYQILEAHQRGILAADAAVARIAQNARIPKGEAEALLQEYLPVGHLEFHPSDKCNLRCLGCTYAQGVEGLSPAQVDFPYHYLRRLTDLEPRSLLLSGGGEPTLCGDNGCRIHELVAHIHEFLPQTQLGLITNGTHLPPGSWMDPLQWVRLSIDAATPQTYEAFKGRPLFDRVERHLLGYLETASCSVGGSFLYSKANIREYVPFIRHFYELVLSEIPEALPRLNLSFRPLRRNPTDKGREFPEAISEEDIAATVSAILAFAHESHSHANFLRERTNVEAVLGGNLQPEMPFERCYYAQIFHIVRANGDLRPCFVRVLDPGFSLGNLIYDSPTTISLRTLYIGTRKQEHCDPNGCRQCHVNHILEQGLRGEILPLTSEVVAQDPFF